MTGSAVPVVRTIAEVRAVVRRFREAGETVALVPTMGALHDGHLSLVRGGHERCRRVVVSIFVNPRQFAEQEDLRRYPRSEAADLARLATVSCDLAWAPTAEDMYSEGFATWVEPGGAAEGLEADFRPRHFGGVATVCLKLFAAVSPDVAVFGEKDYQQLCVIRQLVRDFNLPLEIVAAPTVREPDGLALSSRNVFLSLDERRIAPSLYHAIRTLAEKVGRGPIAEACRGAAEGLIRSGLTKVDYVAVRDAETLGQVVPSSGRPSRVLAAAWLGRTRLIDNVGV